MNSINSTCPWSGDPVAGDSTTRFKGHRVGFCNPGCRDKFDRAIAHFEHSMRENGVYSPMKAAFIRLADYNAWINEGIFSAAATLADEDYRKDLGSFFGSIHGTLNHILVWDVTWLQRYSASRPGFSCLRPIAAMQKPTSHEQILYDDLSALQEARGRVDDVLRAFVLATDDDEYEQVIRYRVSSGEWIFKKSGGLIQHVFNHQTHHRGQVTTLLSQLGVDPGTTDLLAILPDEQWSAEGGGDDA